LSTADDIAAIAGVIADVETGFNTKDAELSVAHFAPDATAVSVTGALVAGRDELLEAHRAGYAGPLRDQYARYELGDVTFLRPDVAVVHKRATATTREGEPIDVGHAMIALYVLVREEGRWLVAARQNTLVT
jgi:uncharacterized protein (TIGR02246 family)